MSPFRGNAGFGAREREDCSGYWSSGRSPHSDIGTYSQSAGALSAGSVSDSAVVTAAAAGFFLRLRPPRVPRRVFFFGFGASASSALPLELVGSDSEDSDPNSGSGTWIFASAGAAPFVAAFFRPRPPREPRRVFFFGVSPSAGSSVSASAFFAGARRVGFSA